jgi:hypothetical protein
VSVFANRRSLADTERVHGDQVIVREAPLRVRRWRRAMPEGGKLERPWAMQALTLECPLNERYGLFSSVVK